MSSNQKIRNMSKSEWEDFQNLEKEIYTCLRNGIISGLEPESEDAKEIVALHKSWLEKSWKEYTVEAHKA